MIEQHSQSIYSQFQAALLLAGVDISASELHGLIYGTICSAAATGSDADVCELAFAGRAGAPAISDAMRHKVADLVGDANRLLTAASSEIELMLPVDDDDVVKKTEALADWCRGFTLGLLHNMKLTVDGLPADAAEITRDLLAIAEVEAGDDDPTAAGWALAELEEYVRVGVQVIYEELRTGGAVSRARTK